MKPKYQHDCESCKYLGTSKANILNVESECDFYICGNEELRTLIARYGDDGPEYSSTPLFACVTFTPLDLIAILNGFEFNKYEEERAFKVLVNHFKNSLSREDYKRYSLPDIDLGKGNFFDRR
jgi:hypothetical protein